MGCSPSSITVQFESRPPYEEVRFLERDRRNIDKYFYHLSATLRNKSTQEEIIHVRDTVERSVGLILESVAIIDKRFFTLKKNGLLKVGSFYEGTHITGSNRFDYVAILDEFTPEVITLDIRDTFQNYLPVRVHVYDVKDTFTKRWKDIVHETELIGSRSRRINKPGLLDTFIKRLQTVTALFTPRATKFGTLSADTNTPVQKHESSAIVKFVLTKVKYRIREAKLCEERTSYVIHVRITPAIKWGDVGDYVYADDIPIQKLYDAIIKAGSFLVVPSSDGFFKVAFTDTESKLLQMMSTRHKRALGVIKYLIKGDKSFFELESVSKYAMFDSRSLKMIMLALESTCPCSNGLSGYDLYECVIHVMKVMQASLHNFDMLNHRDWHSASVDDLSEAFVYVTDDDLEECRSRVSIDFADENNEVHHEDENNAVADKNMRNLEDEITISADKSMNGVGNDDTDDADKDTNALFQGKNSKTQEGIALIRATETMEDTETQFNVVSEEDETDAEEKDLDDSRKTVYHLNENEEASLSNASEERVEVDKIDRSSLRGKRERLPLEYDILRLLSSTMCINLNETTLYVNCVNFQELMKHDLKYWIGQRERYDLHSANPNYGVTCLQEKLQKNTLD